MHLLKRGNGGFGIQRVEDCFHQDAIYPAFHEGGYLFAIGALKGIERDGTCCRVLGILTHREHLARRTDRADHETGFAGGLFRHPVGFLTGEAGRSKVHLAHGSFRVILRLGDALCAEGVGLNNISPGLQILAVYLPDNIGAGECQQVIVALEQRRGFTPPLPTEIILRELLGLDHRAHGSVQDQYSVFYCVSDSH